MSNNDDMTDVEAGILGSVLIFAGAALIIITGKNALEVLTWVVGR